MRRLFKFLISLSTIASPTTLVIACSLGPSVFASDQDVVDAIVGFNKDNKWSMTVDKIGINNLMQKISNEIKSKLSGAKNNEFSHGEFIIYQFSKLGSQEALDNSYFTSPHENETLVFNFKFNSVVSDASINLTINNNINDQDIVDAIKNLNHNQEFNIGVDEQDTDGFNFAVKAIKNSISDNFEPPLKDYFQSGEFIIEKIFDHDNIPVDDTFFTSQHEQMSATFNFSFNNIKAQASFNLTVFHKISNDEIFKELDNIQKFHVTMNRNYQDGLAELKNQLFSKIKSDIKDEAIFNYITSQNFLITEIFKDNNLIDDSYFHETHHKETLQFKYKINNMLAPNNLVFDITVHRGDILNEDITKALQTVNKVVVQVNAQSSGGLNQAKKNIANAILKNLEKIDQPVAKSLIAKNFKINEIKNNGVVIDDSYFQIEKPFAQMSYQYSFDDSITGENTTNLQVLAKKEDQVVVDAIENLSSQLLKVDVTNSDGLQQLKTKITKTISERLLKENDDESIQETFDSENFEIKTIKIDDKVIDDKYFNLGKTIKAMNISYTFGSLSSPNPLLSFALIVKESDKVVSDTIKKVFPQNFDVSDGTNAKNTKQMLIAEIYKNINATNNKIKESTVEAFNADYKSKLILGDLMEIKSNGKEVKVDKFNFDWIFSNTHNIKINVTYGSFKWVVNLKILVK